jgi:hypothetical protein
LHDRGTKSYQRKIDVVADKKMTDADKVRALLEQAGLGQRGACARAGYQRKNDAWLLRGRQSAARHISSAGPPL